MAVKARFDADFGQFVSELGRVDVKLRDFSASADKSSARLQRMADSLNGNKIAEQAALSAAALDKIGGASQATERQLQKLAAPIREFIELAERRGQAVPKVFRDIANEADRAALSVKKITLRDIDTGTLTKAGTVLSVGVAAAFAVTTRAAVQFESAFANVRKTVNASDDEFKRLERGVRDLAKEIPVSVTELSNLAAVGGQFGVSSDQLLKFTKTVAALGVAVDGISAENAAASLSQIANLTNTKDDFDRLASTLVRLGNEGNSTEGDILELTKRLSAAGTQAGLSASEIFGFAGAMANVGIEAEAGGAAVSKVFTTMRDAALDGGAALDVFSSVAGKASADFAKLFKESPAQAITEFIEGLGRIQKESKSLTSVFEALDLKDARLKDSLGRLALASADVSKQVATANDEWKTNNALVEESGKKYGTTENQLKTFYGRLNDINITLGGPALQALNSVLETLTPLTEQVGKLATAFAELPTPARNAITMLGLGAGFAGVLLIVSAKAIDAGKDIYALVTAIRALTVAEGAAGAVGALSGSVGALATNAARLRGVLAAGGLVGAVGTAGYLAASSAIENYNEGLTETVQRQRVLAEAQRILGRDANSFGQAWTVARASFDQTAKSTQNLTKEQLELKKALDALNPFIGGKPGGLAGLSPVKINVAPNAIAPKPTAPSAPKLPASAGPAKAELAAMNREADRLQARLDKLTGRDLLRDAQTAISDIFGKAGVGLSALPDKAILSVFDKLADAREIARRIEPGAVQGLASALDRMAKHPSVVTATKNASRDLFTKMLGPDAVRASADSIAGQSGRELIDKVFGTVDDLLATKNPIQFMSLAPVVTDMRHTKTATDALTTSTKEWRTALRDVSQAFANLSQISGGAFDGVTQSLGVVLGAADAATSAVQALGDLFKSEKFASSGAGKALAGGLAGLAAGPAFAQLVGANSGKSAFLSGGAGGAAAGFAATGGNPIGAGVGFAVGAVSALLAQRAQEKALRAEMDRNRESLLANFDSREDLIRQAQRVGLSESYITSRILDNTKNADAYADAVNRLNAAFAAESRQAAALSKSLGEVAKVNGVLSLQQTKDLRDALVVPRPVAPTRSGPGTSTGIATPKDNALAIGERRIVEDGPKKEAAEAFLRQQGESLLAGLGRILEQPGALTPSLVRAVGQSLPAALAELERQGVSSIDALRTLQPLLEKFQEKAVLAGAGSTPGFDALNAQLAILKDERLGPLVERANGAGQALGALQNLGLLTEETFSGFAASITETVAGMDLLSDQGQNAMRLIRQPLQNVWQLQRDFGLEVDAATQKLLDQAEAAGLIGDKFRPAEERIAEGIASIVERLDQLIDGFTNGFPQAAIAGAGKAAKGIEDTFAKLKPIITVDYDARDRHPLGDELREDIHKGGTEGADLAARELDERLGDPSLWHTLRDGIETDAAIGAELGAAAIEDTFAQLKIRVPIHYEPVGDDPRFSFPEDPRRDEGRITLPVPSGPGTSQSTDAGFAAAQAATSATREPVGVYIDGRLAGEAILPHAGSIFEFNGISKVTA
jgi:TP901 family phage tail tape measure protein